MVFLLSSSQWRTRRALALMPKSMRQGLSKIIWERKAGLIFFFFCQLSELCPCLMNCLSIISFGLSGTQSRSDQYRLKRFLNPVKKPVTGMQQMFLHLRCGLYNLLLAIPAGATPACQRYRV